MVTAFRDNVIRRVNEKLRNINQFISDKEKLKKLDSLEIFLFKIIYEISNYYLIDDNLAAAMASLASEHDMYDLKRKIFESSLFLTVFKS